MWILIHADIKVKKKSPPPASWDQMQRSIFVYCLYYYRYCHKCPINIGLYRHFGSMNGFNQDEHPFREFGITVIRISRSNNVLLI